MNIAQGRTMRRILVTAISGDIGNGILKILQEGDDCLFGCDVNEIAAGMDKVDYFWKVCYATEEGYIDEIIEKCKELRITHLIPVNEREIEKISEHRNLFEELRVKIVLLKQSILNICLDKYRTACFLADNDLDVPRTYRNIEQIEDKARRYICKPRRSNGSKDIFTFVPEKDSVYVEEGYVIQEYIDSNEEYTIGVFRHGSIVNTIAFRRELKNGYSNLVVLANEPKLHELAMHIAELLELEGYINIQLRKKDGKYYIFEINPRISGTVRYRHLLGYSDVLWWLDILDGNSIETYKCKYKKAIGIRELNEKYLLLE